ncbi:MAG: cytochrome c oxidase accessory protein CcoG [Alphaproteobacteria bacterium]
MSEHPERRAQTPVMSADGIRQIDVQAVNSEQARDLYKSRVQIYPKLVRGTFRNVKWAVMVVTLAVYYITPWIRWDRGPLQPDQAVLIDFDNRRLYFFWIQIWPQEFFYISGLLILAAVGLFLVTALFGRVWCGYTCPQTVWTDLFIVVERMFEGDRNARIRLDKASWSLDKAGRKIGKHVVWLLISLATGGAWIFYFHNAPDLLLELPRGEAAASSYIFLGVLTFTTYSLAGTMREQVCTYMCPWPRIQAAMIDKHALAVTYRYDRGEPRGPHKKGESWDGRGDCIDCRQCVAVCPAGIDIRDGLQLECIQCALCIDACDEIMDKVGRPRGLIAYDTDDNIERRQQGQPTGFKFVRPRTIFYASIIAVVGSLMLYSLATRTFLELNVIQDRQPLFVRLSDGGYRNGYTVKILNMRPEPTRFQLSVEGIPEATLTLVGRPEEFKTLPPIDVPGDKSQSLRVYVKVHPQDMPPEARVDILFRVVDLERGTVDTARAAFVHPGELDERTPTLNADPLSEVREDPL